MKVSEILEKLSNLNADAEIELLDACSSEYFDVNVVYSNCQDKTVLVFNN